MSIQSVEASTQRSYHIEPTIELVGWSEDCGERNACSTRWPGTRASLCSTPMISRTQAEDLDAADPLASHRNSFLLPAGVRYLDGNSLGALPKGVVERMNHTLTQEWGNSLIRSWNEAGWWELPGNVGAKLAPLIGALPHEVTIADSTSINLFKVVVAAIRMRPGRTHIVVEAGTFATDLYLINEAACLTNTTVVTIPNGAGVGTISAALDEHTAVVCITHVDYRSGRMQPMHAVTAAAHNVGALMIWDLAHSTGAVPVDLNAADADFAVGCGYKYLNGGPGAPSHVYAATRHHESIDQPLPGWHGHARPFDFEPAYAPAAGIARLGCGTPPLLSLVALDAALDLWRNVDMVALRAKSVAMGELLITLADERLATHGFTVASPRVADERGSQVSLAHPHGFAMMQALIHGGTIGDFRAPDLLRFGFAPLYLRYVDVWDAVEDLVRITETGKWDDPRFTTRASVT